MEKGTGKSAGKPLYIVKEAQLEWQGWTPVDCLGDDAQKSSRWYGAFIGFHCLARSKQSRQTLAVFDKGHQHPPPPSFPKYTLTVQYDHLLQIQVIVCYGE